VREREGEPARERERGRERERVRERRTDSGVMYKSLIGPRGSCFGAAADSPPAGMNIVRKCSV
jgi:hypothetical protein